MQRHKKFIAFTLVELMIVALVIGLLAAIAVPNYTATREKALDAEMVHTLGLIWAAERQYMLKNDSYWPILPTISCPGGAPLMANNHNINDINRNLSLSLTPYASNVTILVRTTMSCVGSSPQPYFWAWAWRGSYGGPRSRTWEVNAANGTPFCVGTCY